MKQSLLFLLAAAAMAIGSGAQAADEAKTPTAKTTIEPSDKAKQAVRESKVERVKTGQSGSGSKPAGASKVMQPANGMDRETDTPVKSPAGAKIDKPK